MTSRLHPLNDRPQNFSKMISIISDIISSSPRYCSDVLNFKDQFKKIKDGEWWECYLDFEAYSNERSCYIAMPHNVQHMKYMLISYDIKQHIKQSIIQVLCEVKASIMYYQAAHSKCKNHLRNTTIGFYGVAAATNSPWRSFSNPNNLKIKHAASCHLISIFPAFRKPALRKTSHSRIGTSKTCRGELRWTCTATLCSQLGCTERLPTPIHDFKSSSRLQKQKLQTVYTAARQYDNR